MPDSDDTLRADASKAARELGLWRDDEFESIAETLDHLFQTTMP